MSNVVEGPIILQPHTFDVDTTHEILLQPEPVTFHTVLFTATILHEFEPFTMAPVMHGSLEGCQVIGEEAVALVNRVSDQDILNRDVRLDNILVTEKDPRRLVMIDFRLARVKGEDEDDEKWTMTKRTQDKGAVGYVCEASEERVQVCPDSPVLERERFC